MTSRKTGYFVCDELENDVFIPFINLNHALDGDKVKADDAHAQTLNILERVEKVLEDLNAGMKDVIRTRIFTTDVTTFEAVATAHAHFFKDIKPTTGFYGINQLVAPEYLVEIELTAVLAE